MKSSAPKKKAAKKGKSSESPVRNEENFADAVEKSDRNSINLNQQIAKSREEQTKETSRSISNRIEVEKAIPTEVPVALPQAPKKPYFTDLNSTPQVIFSIFKTKVMILYKTLIFL